MVKLKICGLTRQEDIEAINQVLPDYIGFVFAESRRKVDIKKAAQLAKMADNRIKKVGVFVNEDILNIVRLAGDEVIDLVQLHGDEDEAYISLLREKIKIPIIKAVRVQNPEEIIKAAKLPCEYLLLDTYTKNQYGGSGKAFDWRMIPKLSKPYFLAGGLGTGNILQSLKECRPYVLDISSGVETDGLKDKQKIIEIARLLRSER